MIGFLLSCAGLALAVVLAAFVLKRPLAAVCQPDPEAPANDSLARWAMLMDTAAKTCKEALSPPESPESFSSSAWNVGSPVQPADFTRQLGSLQTALGRARAPKIPEQVQVSGNGDR